MRGPWIALILFAVFAICYLPVAAQTGEDQTEERAEDPTQDVDDADAEAEEAASRDAFVDEIVVTSRRREENLQNVPISVTAFGRSAIEQRSLIDLSEVAAYTPNLEFTIGSFANDSTEAAVFIRGVGQGDTAIFSDPGVGIYLDGVYLARAQGAILDLLDVERIEVLRGPQGTLFGKNTTGGAIQLVTRRPERELGGSAAVTAGSYDRLDGRVHVDVPLGDEVHGSFAAMTTDREGWARSVATGQDLNDDGRDLARLALEWTPERGPRAFLTAHYLDEKENGAAQLLLAVDPTPLIRFYNRVVSDQGFTPFTSALVTDDFSETTARRVSVDGEIFGVTLDLEWGNEDLLFRSITGYREVDYRNLGDGDGSFVPLAEAEVEETQDQVSQELQLLGTTAKADWVLGAIYFEENPRDEQTQRVLGNLFQSLEAAPGPIYAPPGVPDFLCDPGPPPPGLPCFGGAGNPLNFAFLISLGEQFFLDLENQSWAVFGESTWRVADRVSFSLGGRWTEDDKAFSYRTVNALGITTNDLFNEDSWSDWSGRASLSFQVRPEVQLFANLSRGFKSGGFNGRPQGRGRLDPFEPETVESLELGWKSDLLDRRLRLNGAVFASEYDDMHFAASLAGEGGQPVFVTQNAGDSEIEGFELEAELHAGIGWVLNGSVGYLQTELVEVVPSVPPGIDVGDELPHSPETQLTLGVQKFFPVGRSGSLIARADYSYRDDIFFDLANTPTLVQEAYGLLSARIVYGPDSGRWELAVFGTNLGDEEYLTSGFTAAAFGPSIGTAGRPAEVGATFTYHF